MRFPRSSGIILHPTSFPGRFGIGDLGEAAYRFVDFLEQTGARIWQILPLGPTGYGDSPYQAFSAFAGNPYLINLDALVEDGLLSSADLDDVPEFPNDTVDYGWVIPYKIYKLDLAAERFMKSAPDGQRADFDRFCEENRSWLDDYALFAAVKDAHNGKVWTEWEYSIAQREPGAIDQWKQKLEPQIFSRKFQQFQFYSQWSKLKAYCGSKGIKIFGDIPIYVAYDGADVWANRHLFKLNAKGYPTVVAGVPPDYFSETGQLWGNPIFEWEAHQQEGYAWWIERFRHTLKAVDMVRIDHFRGFESYWEVPAGEKTAINGVWKKGPGTTLFDALEKGLGELPIIAEDLGLITPEVEALRDELEFPGMAVMQFAFGSDATNTHLPHNYKQNLVAYTGTHDNDTTVGWWKGGEGSTLSSEALEKERDYARRYLNTDGWEIHWTMIRAVMASVADTAVVPLQDLFGLDTKARMNQPGRPSGNWQWRYVEGALSDSIAERFKEIARVYGREG